jgi:hypothetical protein
MLMDLRDELKELNRESKYQREILRGMRRKTARSREKRETGE